MASCGGLFNMNLVAQDHALGAVEGIGARDDDPVAGGQAVEYFDFGETGGAEQHLAAFGDIAVHDVGKSTAVLVDEGAAIDHQHVAALVDDYAHRQPLALAKAGGLFVAEAQPGRDLAVDDFGRYSAHAALPVMSSALEVRDHARPQIPRETFGHFDLHLQRREVDDGEQRRIFGHTGAVGHLHLSNLAVHWGSHIQAVDLAPEIGDQVLLAVEQRLLALDIESTLFGLRLIIHFGLFERKLRLLQRILGFESLQLRVGPQLVGLAAAIEFALRGSLVN